MPHGDTNSIVLQSPIVADVLEPGFNHKTELFLSKVNYFGKVFGNNMARNLKKEGL